MPPVDAPWVWVGLSRYVMVPGRRVVRKRDPWSVAGDLFDMQGMMATHGVVYFNEEGCRRMVQAAEFAVEEGVPIDVGVVVQSRRNKWDRPGLANPWVHQSGSNAHVTRFAMPRWNRSAGSGFVPVSGRLPGWFDYQDVYRRIVEEAPDGSGIVEVGVWAGKSLAYLAEYASLLGKDLTITGYDHFDPSDALGSPGAEAMTSDEWMERVRLDLRICAPSRPPRIVRGDSAASAENHADGSLFAVWIDASHEKDSVMRDVRAWLPKVVPGGILAGHDYRTHPGVRSALDELSLPVRRVSRNGWMLRV